MYYLLLAAKVDMVKFAKEHGLKYLQIKTHIMNLRRAQKIKKKQLNWKWRLMLKKPSV